ncbi:MAG: response regulator transcription factor [Deltaproteobacteria bacterium]|nr:response regulator transcription factor [Deltaproteobacteria bacterium]
MLRILIADDHPIFRNGLKQILDEEEEMEVADEAADGRQALDLLTRKSYDALVLDIEMKGMGGLEVLKQVRRDYPELPVLILSFYPEEQYALRAFRLGAHGYLTKDSAVEELVLALNRIISGKKFITSTIAERLSDLLINNGNEKSHEQLSHREYEVFLKIADGKSVSEISNDLSLSPKTVSTYKTRIFEKMEMTSDAQVIRYAIEKDLVK